ncbi:MAG: hypothetical protein HZB81_00365 [Deltaproteobacteria bacterium]|nr:hypothetical protein [Deltaproteobacteria bacterium]
MLYCGSEIDKSVVLVKNTCDSEEFEIYRKAIGKIMGTMLVDIMNPIYKQYPDIKPPQLK